jgi:NAD(P)-dependent dehydrogenase (short-subunit alcohol dehydrogenase family)
MDLTNKHILIAGGSSGIGAEIARYVTELGGKVSLIARNENKLKKVITSLYGNNNKYYLLDLNNTDLISLTIQNIFNEQGAFDGIVYCAGVGDACPIKMLKPEKLESITSVNFFGFVEVVRCATVSKYKKKIMSIVGISSIESEKGDKGKTAYCSTKAAMNGAMRAMAHELAEQNIRVNNVLPGWVRTDMYLEQVKRLGEENIKKELEMFQYIGRPIETIDIANAVAFLLSDASRYITGTEMIVAGGYLS